MIIIIFLHSNGFRTFILYQMYEVTQKYFRGYYLQNRKNVLCKVKLQNPLIFMSLQKHYGFFHIYWLLCTEQVPERVPAWFSWIALMSISNGGTMIGSEHGEIYSELNISWLANDCCRLSSAADFLLLQWHQSSRQSKLSPLKYVSSRGEVSITFFWKYC